MPDSHVHIGLPKTASTFLQEEIFARVNGFNYLGIPFPNNEVRDTFLKLNYWTGDKYAAAALSALPAGSGPTLFSDETLSYSIGVEREEKARRLKALFKDAKILIVIRSQFKILVSRYLEYLKNHTYVTLHQWLSAEYYIHRLIEDLRQYPEYKPATKLGVTFEHVFRDLDYHALADTYARLFGKENIHIQLFEDLVQEPDRFMNGLAAFLDTSADELRQIASESNTRNVSNNFVGAIFRSFVPPRFHRFILTHAAYNLLNKHLPRRTPRLSDQWRQRVNDHFADSNARLAANFGLDLKGHQYPF